MRPVIDRGFRWYRMAAHQFICTNAKKREVYWESQGGAGSVCKSCYNSVASFGDFCVSCITHLPWRYKERKEIYNDHQRERLEVHIAILGRKGR